MAKYEIRHCGGHEGTIQLFGPNKERQQKIEWLESQPCVQCRLAGTEDLTGSEKQRAWAGEIRQAKLYGLSAEDAEILMSVKSASWWIDHRGHSGASLAQDIRHQREVEERAETIVDRELSGKDKEVKRAKAIRRNMIAAVQLIVETTMTGDEASAQRKQVVDTVTSWIDCDTHDTAWYIGSRHVQYDGYALVRTAAESMS